MVPHTHRYRFECEETEFHKHRLHGHTDYMIGINVLHFHYFCGISSYNNHTHYFSGITGLPIKTENGHIHRIEGFLESNNTHEHKFSDFTFEDIEYFNRKIIREALS